MLFIVVKVLHSVYAIILSMITAGYNTYHTPSNSSIMATVLKSAHLYQIPNMW